MTVQKIADNHESNDRHPQAGPGQCGDENQYPSVRPTWTARHYLPCLMGAVFAATFSNVAYHGGLYGMALLGVDIRSPYTIPIIAQGMLWLGIWLGKKAWFG